MNKQQKEYALAKTILETLKAEENDMEKEFCDGLGVVNDDGSIPKRTWAIDNDEIAEKAIDDFGKILEDSGLWAKILEAEKRLRKAEDDMISYSLSLVPYKKERETLENAARINYTTRQKIIDLAFRLDTKTVTA